MFTLAILKNYIFIKKKKKIASLTKINYQCVKYDTYIVSSFGEKNMNNVHHFHLYTKIKKNLKIGDALDKSHKWEKNNS